MNQFGKLYSEYYDLLYSDKDYPSEAEYINRLIKKFDPKINSILDLGCGTGKHAELLCDKGYVVHGVDMSEDMLKIAESKREGKENRLSYSQSNILDLSINRKFDAVISLFHVMSYQNTNEELIKAFEVAKKHLKKGGVFIFDFWYGPAVLTDLPTITIKRLKNSAINVTRIGEPVLHSTKNIVDVNFTVFIQDKKTDEVFNKKEVHNMRYFFDTELELVCEQTGFKIEDKFKWMNDNHPDFNSWNVVWVVKN
jgi:SAM-dependent methyltransferase